VSTRSIDRYIRGGRLRSKKEGKIIYINDNDIENLKNGSEKQEVIIPQKVDKENRQEIRETKKEISQKDENTKSESKEVLESIYQDLKQEIQKKDEIIQNLSIQLGKAEEIAKNSISLMEFKKSQFLLEESKGHLS